MHNKKERKPRYEGKTHNNRGFERWRKEQKVNLFEKRDWDKRIFFFCVCEFWQNVLKFYLYEITFKKFKIYFKYVNLNWVSKTFSYHLRLSFIVQVVVPSTCHIRNKAMWVNGRCSINGCLHCSRNGPMGAAYRWPVELSFSTRHSPSRYGLNNPWAWAWLSQIAPFGPIP